MAKESLLFCDRQDYIKPEVAASFANVIGLLCQHEVDLQWHWQAEATALME